MLFLISLLRHVRSMLFSCFCSECMSLPLITMIYFLIFSEDKCCDEANKLSSVTLCGMQSYSLTKQDDTDRVELIAKHCLHSKCLSFPCFVLIVV